VEILDKKQKHYLYECKKGNEKAYVLTFTGVAAEFEKCREVGGKIMDSFKLK
jgi:hypothetical protein